MMIVVRHLLGYQLSLDGPEVPVYFDHYVRSDDLITLVGPEGATELLLTGTCNDGEWTRI